MCIAISENDLRSVEILLGHHDLQIDYDNSWSYLLHHLPNARDTNIVKVVIQALKWQRRKLRDLAARTLSKAKVLQLAGPDEILDRTAPTLYQALLDFGIDVPSTLNPAMGDNPSTYHAVLIETGSGGPTFNVVSLTLDFKLSINLVWRT